MTQTCDTVRLKTLFWNEFDFFFAIAMDCKIRMHDRVRQSGGELGGKRKRTIEADMKRKLRERERKR